MKSKVSLENKKKDDKHIIKMMGMVDGSIAEELVEFLLNELNGKTLFLLDFKDAWRIEESALNIISDALKNPELKRRKIQFCGITTREAKFFRNHGVKVSKVDNGYDILKQGGHSNNELAMM